MRFRFCSIMFAISLCSGCGGESTTPTTSAKSSSGSSETASQPATGSLAYPELYTSANLPQYADATLTDTGRQTTSLNDGLKLQLESSDGVQTIAKYFEEEMRKLGWDVPEPKFRMETNYIGRYTKGDTYFQMTITKLGENPSKIIISYAQN